MKRCISFLLIIFLLASTTVNALTNSLSITPRLSFNGTTANCSIILDAENSDDEISVTLKLWRGNTCLATWTDKGTGRLRISETQSVLAGYAYLLTADVTLNGSTQPRATTSAMCK